MCDYITGEKTRERRRREGREGGELKIKQN